MGKKVSDWWNNRGNVDSYIKMTTGYAGADFLEHLYSVLPEGSTLLELGMGPGKDLEILARRYAVTGSDVSEVFLNLYRDRYPEADLLTLDAVYLHMGSTIRQFDAIFSNKVLVHLTAEELKSSLSRQVELLNPGGVLCHTLWTGDGEDDFDGLHFSYWNDDTLKAMYPDSTVAVLEKNYTEDERDDSILVILKSGI
jgi:cyclopropane fatty-acyl-phospholipid synthase-like methyltransferase